LYLPAEQSSHEPQYPADSAKRPGEQLEQVKVVVHPLLPAPKVELMSFPAQETQASPASQGMWSPTARGSVAKKQRARNREDTEWGKNMTPM